MQPATTQQPATYKRHIDLTGKDPIAARVNLVRDGHSASQHDLNGSLDDLLEGAVGSGSTFVGIVGAGKISNVHSHASVQI